MNRIKVIAPSLLRVFLLSLICCFSHFLQAQGGYTLDFDGADDYVDCGNIPFSSTMTVEAWINTSDVSSRNVFFSWGNTTPTNIVEFRTTSGNLEFVLNDGSFAAVTGTANISDGNWHHVVAVKNGSSISLYIDGKLENTGTISKTITVNLTYIGVLNNTGVLEPDSYFNGKIDDVRIWDDARSQAEIQANMNKELVGNEANLVAYYKMSDGTGSSLTDNSTNSNTGTFSSSPAWKTSGALSGPRMALDFDGTSEYVTCGNDASLSLSSAGTLETWIKADALPSTDALLVHKYLCYGIELENDGNVQVYWHGTSVESIITTNTPISTGNWYHIAAVYDGSTKSIYVNGELMVSGATSGTITSNSLDLCIGTHSSDPVRDFDGMIDEVRVWNTGRTQAQIRANMYRNLSGDESGLVAYYRFDQQPDATHTALYDLTTNGNNGTLTNMAPASDWVASNPFNTWIGSEDTDWTNGANWSSGVVPTSTIDVGLYPWSGSNAPALSGSANAKQLYVDAGVSFSNTGTLTLQEHLFNQGTISGSGSTVFSGTSVQTIDGAGTTTFGVLTVDNATGVNLEKDVTATTLALTDGALSIGANTISINGAISQTTGSLTGSSSSNIGIGGAVASTSLPAVTVNNLTLNRANGITLGGTVTVNGSLALTDGVLDLNANTLVLGDAATVSGTPGNSNHIDASSGLLRKNYSATGSFDFPVGDGTVYTPIDLDFTSGTFTSGYAVVNLVAAKHPNNSSPTNFIDRYWTVTSSGITGFSCDVTATYDDSDINGTETVMHGGKWNGSSWLGLGDVTAGTNQVTGTVTSFSDITAGEESTFPVEWLNFSATPAQSSVLLDWTTAIESNSDFFGVERSVDQNIWEKLGQVDAAGTTTQPTSYNFVDKNPIMGTTAYRLRQVDIDGAFDYSPIVEITFLEGGVSIYPNPVQDVLVVDLGQKNQLYATLFDMVGKIVFDVRLYPGNNTLPFMEIPSGVYVLKLTDRKGWKQVQQILKK